MMSVKRCLSLALKCYLLAYQMLQKRRMAQCLMSLLWGISFDAMSDYLISSCVCKQTTTQAYNTMQKSGDKSNQSAESRRAGKKMLKVIDQSHCQASEDASMTANLATVRMTTLAVIIVFGTALFGCAGPKIQMTVVDPPSVAEALKLKRIAMGEFEGPPHESSSFAQEVENLLTSVRVQGKPYFEIVSRPVNSSVNADGIFLGSIVRSSITENPYQEVRSQCAQSRTRYNKKGKPIGEECIRWSKYTVNCIKRDAVFEFSPRLIETATDRSIFSDKLKGSAFAKGCSDSRRPVMDGAGLLAQARKDVLTQIRVALAPVETRVAAEIMKADSSWFNEAGSMRSKESVPKFAGGFEFAKAGRMDRACEIWKEMEPIENEYIPLLYNIGLCEESSGNEESARDYFTRADRLSKTPDKRIATALARIGKQIGSKQVLTKARPDIFYRSAQTRTVQQDQRIYGYAKVNSLEVKIRNATAFPDRVRAGETVKLTLDYSVMAPKGIKNVDVTESMILKHDGKVMITFPDRPIKRSLGGSSAEVDLPTPAKMPPGTYVIEYKVQAGTSNDIRPVVFVVGT
ncbi:MAG: tetratricopeptide repeat protein [Gammaproteobacteria bacterium]